MNFSNYLEQALMNHVFGGVPYTAPSSLYMGLSTVAVTDTTAPSEPAGANGYARQLVTFTRSGYSIYDTQGQADLASTPVAFPEATGDWGTILSVVIYDAATGGNILAYATLDASRVVNATSILNFDQLDFTINVSANSGLYVEILSELIDHVFLGLTYTAPTAWYLGINRDSPMSNPNQEVTEPGDSNYARQAVTFTVANGVATLDAVPILFPEVNSITITAWAVTVFSAATGGTEATLLGYNNFTSSVGVDVGERFRVNSFTLSMD